MLRSSALILFLSRPFLEENLRDIPIFYNGPLVKTTLEEIIVNTF